MGQPSHLQETDVAPYVKEPHMSPRRIVLIGMLVAGIFAPCTRASLSAQGQKTAPKAATGKLTSWVVPRTADGQPDLQGVWANNVATPLQRPQALAGKSV